MTSDQTSNNHFFQNLPVLSNDRLVLKGIQPHDLATSFEFSVYDGVFANNEVEAIHILEKINHDVADCRALHWGIFLRKSGELVGTCGYYRGFENNTGEIGYILHPSFQRLGIMTEALNLIVILGFDILNLQSVIAYTDPNNLASIAVLQRVGFAMVNNEGANLKFEKRHPASKKV
jgi:ribosomal-protein-alanine N-acetyltransferase